MSKFVVVFIDYDVLTYVSDEMRSTKKCYIMTGKK